MRQLYPDPYIWARFRESTEKNIRKDDMTRFSKIMQQYSDMVTPDARKFTDQEIKAVLARNSKVIRKIERAKEILTNRTNSGNDIDKVFNKTWQNKLMRDLADGVVNKMSYDKIINEIIESNTITYKNGNKISNNQLYHILSYDDKVTRKVTAKGKKGRKARKAQQRRERAENRKEKQRYKKITKNNNRKKRYK